jgi:hypothetical protein
MPNILPDLLTFKVCCSPAFNPAVCMPGRFASNGDCSVCPKGMVCTGGSNAPSNCPSGLSTVMSGARSFEQCMTTAGYGRAIQKVLSGQIVVQGQLCPVGSYNAGGNGSPCQRCSAGLTTAGEGARSAKECGESRS